MQHAEGGTRVRHSPDSGPGGQGLEPAFGGTPASLGREPALCQARRHGPDPDLCGGRPTSRWSRDAGPDPAPPARSRPQPAFLLSATTPPVLTQTPAHCLGLPDPRALSLPFSSWGLTECLVGAGSVSPSCHIPFTCAVTWWRLSHCPAFGARRLVLTELLVEVTRFLNFCVGQTCAPSVLRAGDGGTGRLSPLVWATRVTGRAAGSWRCSCRGGDTLAHGGTSPPPPALAARRLVAAGAVRSGVWGAGPRPLTQSSSFLQMSKVWDDLKPKLHCLFAGPNST